MALMPAVPSIYVFLFWSVRKIRMARTSLPSRSLLLPVPPARLEPLVHMGRRRRDRPHRFLILRHRNHDLAGMQMQNRLAEAGTVPVDIVADDWPAHFGTMDAQLVGSAGDGLKCQPGKIV